MRILGLNEEGNQWECMELEGYYSDSDRRVIIAIGIGGLL